MNWRPAVINGHLSILKQAAVNEEVHCGSSVHLVIIPETALIALYSLIWNNLHTGKCSNWKFPFGVSKFQISLLTSLEVSIESHVSLTS